MVKRTVALFGLYMLTPLLVGALGVSALRGLACAEPGWKWIGGDASPSGRVTVHGPADVNINGGQLTAKLYDPDGVTLAQTLKGSINSGRVNAVRRVHDSDVGDETMSGTYTKERHGNSVGEAIIVQTKWGFVGITRTVPK